MARSFNCNLESQSQCLANGSDSSNWLCRNQMPKPSILPKIAKINSITNRSTERKSFQSCKSNWVCPCIQRFLQRWCLGGWWRKMWVWNWKYSFKNTERRDKNFQRRKSVSSQDKIITFQVIGRKGSKSLDHKKSNRPWIKHRSPGSNAQTLFASHFLWVCWRFSLTIKT